MAKRVFKYVVRIDSAVQTVFTDPGAEILGVGLQYDPQHLEDVIVFWAVHTEGVETVGRRFEVVGTGHLLPDTYTHRGVIPDPPYVWHLLEV